MEFVGRIVPCGLANPRIRGRELDNVREREINLRFTEGHALKVHSTVSRATDTSRSIRVFAQPWTGGGGGMEREWRVVMVLLESCTGKKNDAKRVEDAAPQIYRINFQQRSDDAHWILAWFISPFRDMGAAAVSRLIMFVIRRPCR